MPSDLITRTGVVGSDLVAESMSVNRLSAISLLRHSRAILSVFPSKLVMLCLKDLATATKCAKCDETVYLLSIEGQSHLVDWRTDQVGSRLVVPFHRCMIRGGAA